jgi:hypothetical protein
MSSPDIFDILMGAYSSTTPRRCQLTVYKPSRLVLLGCVISILAVACTDANDQFIQGYWYWRSAHLDQIAGETYQEVSWTFDRGTFEYYSCCFSGESHLAGRYRITKSEETRIVLELFNIRGGATSGPGEIGIKIDRESDTLSIQATGPFTRTLYAIR